MDTYLHNFENLPLGGFQFLVAILKSEIVFLINLSKFQINKFQKMPGRGQGKDKAKPKPKNELKKKFLVPIGFDDLDLNYSMFITVRLTDVLMGG